MWHSRTAGGKRLVFMTIVRFDRHDTRHAIHYTLVTTNIPNHLLSSFILFIFLVVLIFTGHPSPANFPEQHLPKFGGNNIRLTTM
jgi:hypothetical protein